MTHCIGCTLPVDEGALRCARCLEAHVRAEAGYDEPGPTLTEALAALGMTHRAPPPGRQGREIFDGTESLGVCTSEEGWQLVRAREAQR